MNKTENKTNTHKEPLFSLKTTVSAQEVEGLNNHVYETLNTKIKDLKQKGMIHGTWRQNCLDLILQDERYLAHSNVLLT